MPFYPQLEQALMNLARSFSALHIDEIAKKFGGVLESIQWMEIEPQTSLEIGAVDSSFAVINTRFTVLYVVQGLGLSPSIKPGCIRVDVGSISFEGMLAAQGLRRASPKRIVSMIAQLHELSIANELVQRGSDIVAMDGSALSFIMARPVKKVVNVGVRSSSMGATTIGRLLEKRIELVKELKRRLVFVAKSSSIALIAKSVPDMTLLEIARVKRVGSLWRRGRTPLLKLRVRDIAKHLGLEGVGDLVEEVISVTYVRFIDRGPTYQISFVGDVMEDEVNEIVGALLRCSPAGYPIPLESAHRLSKLSRGALNRVLRRLGLPLIEGREVLE